MLPNRETLLCRYHYDPLDRLVDCTPSAQAVTRRFYLKDRLATEIEGAVQRSIMQHDDRLLAQQQRQSGVADTRLLATDQQRSVLYVLDVSRPHPIAYSPYGHRPAESGLLSLLGFNGERPDPVTGCFLLGNGYRAFNQVLMRFNSPDSWSPFGRGGLNGYAYCVGDPINKADPTGHFSGWALVRNNISRIVKMGAASKLHEPAWGNAIPGVAKRVSPTLPPMKRLNDMPDEMLAKVFGHLEGKYLASVSLTSKRMKNSVSALSEINMKKLLSAGQPETRLPKIDSVGFGEVRGIAPSAAVNTGVTLAQAQQDFPYAMTRLVGPNNKSLHYGPRSYLPPQVDQPNTVAAQIRAMNGDMLF
ncbi:RHS repeat-associated core domain-containing protein [Pseudomonas azerbaijanoccidentalis]|uniref:RHS repeat-associated core domain-containing protein n=1 Tax=Pseudomonas azerbaijanoccidentalis TaxID=2842347 RepID=UPI001CEC1266|nr:RHS repeat-associated core domain-containing protein [Pseudomonas azerbaijanoccidentalis]